MSTRAWAWLVALAIAATAAIGILSAIDFVQRTINPEKVIQCQDSPSCRAFITAQIDKAIRSLAHRGGGHQSGPAPGQPPGGHRPPAPPPHRKPPPKPPPPGGVNVCIRNPLLPICVKTGPLPPVPPGL